MAEDIVFLINIIRFCKEAGKADTGKRGIPVIRLVLSVLFRDMVRKETHDAQIRKVKV